MKKLGLTILVISFIFIGSYLLFEHDSKATKDAITVTQPSSGEPLENKEPNEEKTMIYATDKEIPTENLTLLDHYAFDMNNDGEEERIELYTAALKDSNGEMMWDDGQNWLFIVKEKDHAYVLFDDYVQLGTIKYRVFTEGEQNIFHLLTIRTGSAEMVITDYIYNKEDNGFEQKVIYNPDFVNSLHISQ